MNKNLFKASMTVNSAGKSLIKLYTDRDGLFHNGINAELAGIELRDWLVLSPLLRRSTARCRAMRKSISTSNIIGATVV